MNKDFSILNNYFDKVYVLTLERATERQHIFIERFPGLKFEFFKGWDNQLFSMNELKEKKIYDEVAAKKNHRLSRSMTLGQVGCAMGHRLIYEEMLKNNFNKVLIFEDDAHPVEKTLISLQPVLDNQPGNADILLFDYYRNEKRQPLKQFFYYVQHALGLLKWNNKMIRNLYPKPFSNYWMKAGYHEFANAYAINSKAAKKLIELQTPLSFVADHIIPWCISNEILEGYISREKLFQQQSQGGDKTTPSFIE